MPHLPPAKGAAGLELAGTAEGVATALKPRAGGEARRRLKMPL